MQTGVPLIDISPWFSGDSAERSALARAVDEACRAWGFLVVKGHGIDPSLQAAIQHTTLGFFDQPADYKLKYNAIGSAGGRGYYAMEAKSHARTLGQASAPGDLRESFRVGIEPRFDGRDDPAHVAKNPWPDTPADFRTLWETYYAQCDKLGAEMMRLCATALGLPLDWFDDKIERAISNLAAQHYPAPDKAPQPGQIRSGAHTDFGTLTLLLAQDRPGGLQIQGLDGSWHDVKPMPDTYIVNLGDMMAQWTNDRWRSTLHRVINPPEDAASASRRLSMVYFGMPNADTWIECLPTCTDAKHPPKYAPILASEHLSRKLRSVESVKAATPVR